MAPERSTAGMRRRLVGVGRLALLCGALACSPAPPSATRPAPNIVLVAIDTLRVDHVSAYGSRQPETPAIDQLAARGARFERCTATAPTTLASLTSLLTGRYPHTHGVYRNGVRWPPELEGIQRAFADTGYETIGVVSSQALHPLFGVARDFDQWSLPRFRFRRSPQTLRALERILESRERTKPLFLFLHLFDPHAPYTPPAPYDALGGLGSEGSVDGTRQAIRRVVRTLHRNGGTPTPDSRRLEALYAGEVAFLDGQIARLWSLLERHELAQDSYVLLTADHGETFLEHGRGYFDHGRTVHASEVHVPLLLAGPGIEPGLVLPEPVSHVDLAPTLLDLASIGTEPARFAGRSLAARLRDREAPRLPPRPHFSEATKPHREDRPWPNRRLDRAVVRGDYKLILAPRTGEVRLYDLARDPQETVDLSEQPELATLRRELRGVLERWGERAGSGGSFLRDEALRAKLRALGYGD